MTASNQTVADVEHKMAMDAIGFAAQILTPMTDRYAGLIKAEQQMHSFMHVTDPTGYIQALNSDNLRRQVEMSKAALAFILAIQKVKDEVMAPEGKS